MATAPWMSEAMPYGSRKRGPRSVLNNVSEVNATFIVVETFRGKLHKFENIEILILQLSSELLTIMIATRFLDLIVGNNRFQSILGSIDHNNMIVR